jgi:hypothetical protein
MRLFRFCLSVIVVVAIVVFCGCGGDPVKGKIERSVADSLPKLIGPAESYSVRASGSTFGMIRGKISGLDIIGIGVELPAGLRVDRLNVKITDLMVDTDTKQIKRVGSTQFAASLSEKELNRYLANKYPNVPGLKAELRGNKLAIFAKPGVSVLKVAVVADADLVIRDQRILALDLKKLDVAGLGAPGFAREFLESRVGEIFDARDIGYDATLTSVVLGPGTITLSGSLDLMKSSQKTVSAQRALGCQHFSMKI